MDGIELCVFILRWTIAKTEKIGLEGIHIKEVSDNKLNLLPLVKCKFSLKILEIGREPIVPFGLACMLSGFCVSVFQSAFYLLTADTSFPLG